MIRIPEDGIDSSCLCCLKNIVTDGTERVYFCSDRCKDIYETAAKMKKLVDQQIDLDGEIVRATNENFWNIYEPIAKEQ